MAFCRVFLPLLVLTVGQCLATVEVPVYLWGDLTSESDHSSSIRSVSFRDFGVLLKHNFEDEPFTIVFAEETLSPEDFSLKTEGGSSYPYLASEVNSALYLRSVESPLRVLNKFATSEKIQHLTLTDEGLSGDIEPENGKILIINLKDAKDGETRPEMLKRHDEFIKNEIANLYEQDNMKVVAIYTAHYPSWSITHSRVRRQAGNETASVTSGGITTLAFDGLRIYFERIRLLVNGEELVYNTAMTGASIKNETNVDSTIELDANTKVTLSYINRAGYWFFSSAKLLNTTSGVEEGLKLKEDIYALLGFSYRCSYNVSMASVNETISYQLTIQNSRMQPFFNANETGFGDMFNCVGFFTAPIWAGLFVVAILLSVIFYGIMMMMDIRTMDRFDDPKGKTITINAE